jgi:hypothetical protein
MIFKADQTVEFKDLKDVAEFLARQFAGLEAAFNEVGEITLEELHVAPDKYQNGKLYYADGTDWDPGSGRGVYLYDSDGPTWRFLG